MPLVVLVDSGSASASEIVAGALQDHDRALIVGTTSYGKGSAQSLFPMPNGGALKLTTALWYTPSGRSINKARTPDDDEDDALHSLGEQTALPRYNTDAGRTVLGGGGIRPDVTVADSAAATAENVFQAALGKHVSDFRDALAAYALDLKAKHVITSPTFTVTPAMHAELYELLRQRKVPLARSAYDAAAPLVDRLIGYTVARYVFGPRAEFERTTHDDAAINTALRLLHGVDSQRQLLQRDGRR
jgi:carboxyl-terminal processing protease